MKEAVKSFLNFILDTFFDKTNGYALQKRFLETFKSDEDTELFLKAIRNNVSEFTLSDGKTKIFIK
jgi:hypothetical protein